MQTTQTSWTVRGKVSKRSYTATPVGTRSVRLTHKSGVSSVMDAAVVARDITDAELAQWALDATVATVADTATDEERARLAAWVREGARRA